MMLGAEMIFVAVQRDLAIMDSATWTAERNTVDYHTPDNPVN
jgi:hypothetical protein